MLRHLCGCCAREEPLLHRVSLTIKDEAESHKGDARDSHVSVGSASSETWTRRQNQARRSDADWSDFVLKSWRKKVLKS